jgi:hypothetical protein
MRDGEHFGEEAEGEFFVMKYLAGRNHQRNCVPCICIRYVFFSFEKMCFGFANKFIAPHTFHFVCRGCSILN